MSNMPTKQHMRGLAMCFEEAQFNSSKYNRWSNEFDSHGHTSYKPYYFDQQRIEDLKEFLAFEGGYTVLSWCEENMDLTVFDKLKSS